jgi:hypothetical protein
MYVICIHVYIHAYIYMHIHAYTCIYTECIYDRHTISLTGVPPLSAIQSRKKTMLRSVSGARCVQISTPLALHQFCLPNTLPEQLEALQLPALVAGPSAPPALLVDSGQGILPQASAGTGKAKAKAKGKSKAPLVAPPMPVPVALTTAAPAIPMTHSLRFLYVPMDNVTYGVEGACLTGRQQIQWVQQLLDMPHQFVLHIDGKHKLHHGGWILITVGTHTLRWDNHNKTLSTTFIPLVYLMCKQHESLGACLMILYALVAIVNKYFPGRKLEPGACISDHNDSFKNAYHTVFGDVPFGTCWPHIAVKFSEGKYCSKTWEHFDTVNQQISEIHFARSAGMRDLMMIECGKRWDAWGTQMNIFWNSYCQGGCGWDCWSLGLFDCRLCTPSNQAQESWHKDLLISKIPSLFKASTERLFKDGLPDLIEMDAYLKPSKLNFDVTEMSEDMLKRAKWYIDHQATHVRAVKPAGSTEGDGVVHYWVLRESSSYKKITDSLLKWYGQCLEGEKPKGVKDVNDLFELCDALHLVQPASEKWGHCACEGNPMKLVCDCKGCKGRGICSHVFAINHILKQFNVRHCIMEIGKRTSKNTGGNLKRQEKAYERLPTREPDSSDEEEERLLELGKEGK